MTGSKSTSAGPRTNFPWTSSSSVNDPDFPPCEGEPGDKDRTAQVRHSFWVDGAPEDRNEEIADALHALWQTGDWEITRDDRPGRTQVEATNREDHFRMKFLVGQDGLPSLSGYSPCVRADKGA